MCEAAEKDVLSGSMGGNVGKTLGLLALPGGDRRSGSRGRGPVLRVQVVSGQSTTHAAGENPGSPPKPRGGSPNCQWPGSFAHPRCPGGAAGCTPGTR